MTAAYPEFPKADSERNLIRHYREIGSWNGKPIHGPTPWENDIDIVVDALHASKCPLDMTAPALLRGWEAMEDRRCEKWTAGA